MDILLETGRHARASRDPEVLPGVRLGSPDELLSPAYWKWRCDSVDADEFTFRSRGSTLREEVGFCILGGFGITLEVNEAFFRRLQGSGVFAETSQVSASSIFDLLTTPAVVSGRARRYRFPRQRAERIAEAMNRIPALMLDTCNAEQFRDRLATLPGVGPKTASWITRNWLGSDCVAILDIHVLRAGVLMGLFGSDYRLPSDYPSLELRFLDFARELAVPASLLDAVIWSDMRLFGSRLASEFT